MFGQAFNLGFFYRDYIYKEDIFEDSSCIGLYTMDYDFSDSSGNDNDMGVFGSPDHGVSGGLNLGARFDGYNDSARAYPVSDLQGLTSVSISFWFKWDDSASVSNYGHMVNIGDMGGVGNGDAFGIAVGDDGGTFNRVLYGWFPEGSLSTGQTVTDNVWHHVLMTYSGTTIKYYYDGNSTPIATQTRTSLSLQNSAVNRITVGHYAFNGSHHFKGDLDHLRVFNREIQSNELATLYNEKFYSPKATTTNVNYPVTNVAYYKLDNSAVDETGNYSGTESNIEYRFGRYGQAAVFNGSSSKITTNYTTNDSAFTISGWIKHTSTTFSGKYHYLAGKGYYSSSSNTNYWQLVNYTSEFPEFRIRLNASSIAATSSVAMNLNQWHHLAGTVDSSGNMKIYLDGELTGSATGAPSRSMSQGINYGVYLDGTTYFHDGQIDQIRYYPSVLDADEIANLYNEKPETDTSNFKTVLYKGDGGSQYISNVGIDGDLVWLKNRSEGYIHSLYDSSRGAGNSSISNQLSTNTNNSSSWHSPAYGYLSSFDANGFSLTQGSTNADAVNRNTNDYVAWVWKSGGNVVSNTDGTITSQVSANVDAGFSIVKYTGTQTSITVGHGLSSTPEILIVKNTADTVNWFVWNKDLGGGNKLLKLNLSDAIATRTNQFDSTVPTSTVFSVGSHNGTNGSGDTMIAYCWHSVAGYSKIGSYSGGSTNTIVTGFKPSWVMVKSTGSGYWNILDSRRGGDSNNNVIYANDGAAESTHSDRVITFQNNGFSWNATTSGNVNSSGNTYIYMAFK